MEADHLGNGVLIARLFTAFYRKAAARTLEALETAIASAFDAFPLQECGVYPLFKGINPNYFKNSRYEPD